MSQEINFYLLLNSNIESSWPGHTETDTSSTSITQDSLLILIMLVGLLSHRYHDLVFQYDSLFQFLVFSKIFSNGGMVNLVVHGNIFQMSVSKLNQSSNKYCNLMKRFCRNNHKNIETQSSRT